MHSYTSVQCIKCFIGALSDLQATQSLVLLVSDKTGVLQYDFDANGNEHQATDNIGIFAHG